MSDRHYQVKFTHPNTKATVYGIAHSHSPEAKEAAARGMVIVDDAITPEQYEVPEAELTDIPTDMTGFGVDEEGFFKGGDEYHQFICAEFKKAKKHSDSLGDGVMVAGVLIATPMGDGHAYYVITKVNPRTVDLEWRGYSMDRWVDRLFGYGGRFRKQDVQQFCRKRLFGKR